MAEAYDPKMLIAAGSTAREIGDALLIAFWLEGREDSEYAAQLRVEAAEMAFGRLTEFMGRLRKLTPVVAPAPTPSVAVAG